MQIEKNSIFEEAWANAQRDFARSGYADIGYVASLGCLRSSPESYLHDLARLKFKSKSEQKRPVEFNWSQMEFSVQKEFFVSLQPKERVAMLAMRVGFKVDYNTALVINLAVSLTFVGLGVATASKTKSPIWLGWSVVAAFLGLKLLAGTFERHKQALPIHKHQSGDLLAIEMTDLDTVKSVYKKAAAAEGREAKHSLMVELERAEQDLRGNRLAVA